MQGAVQFGLGECLNPTLAGASGDPPDASSSRLLSQAAGPWGYRARTRMAYWKAPGQRCQAGPGQSGVAQEPGPLSDLVYGQTMQPGYRGRTHAVLARIVITNTVERAPASVEALTAYLPRAFNTLLSYRLAAGRFEVDPLLEEASGERAGPVIASTADGSAALGAVALGGEGVASYAGYRGGDVSKWSIVFRAPGRFKAGPHGYSCVWAIGTRREVEDTLAAFVADQQIHYGPWALAAFVLLLALIAGWTAWRVKRETRPERLEPLGR